MGYKCYNKAGSGIETEKQKDNCLDGCSGSIVCKTNVQH